MSLPVHHHHLLSSLNNNSKLRPPPPPLSSPPRRSRLPPQSHRTSATLRNNSSSAADYDDFNKYSGYLFDESQTDIADDSILNDYDIARIKSVYQKKPLLLLRRLYQTATTLGKWLLVTYIDRVTGRTQSMFQVRAAELRKILVQLGPAYVKIAQAVSSRPDLSLLQDQTTPFPTAVAFRRIEQDLKASVEEIFSKISLVPVAASLLRQVYQARLRDTGKIVAVKVPKPGVHAAILPLLLTCPFTFFCPPLLAAESVVLNTDQKINLEAIVVGIDDFFNKYPFFVTVVGVIWLVVIPLAQDYLSKYKYVSAVDAFVKLREDPNVGLLDIRDDKSLAYLASPNLSLFNKNAVQVHYNEDGNEQLFLKGVLLKFKNPADTVVCVLDNFDGNSLKVAELLVTMGFKEAYAIKGGIRGKKGWQEIQEDLLPPSVHVYPNKREKTNAAQI